MLTWRARQDKQQSSKVQAPIHPSMLQNSAYFDRFSVICSKFCVVSTYNLLLVHSLLLPSCVSAPETFLKISKYHTLLIIPIHPSIVVSTYNTTSHLEFLRIFFFKLARWFVIEIRERRTRAMSKSVICDSNFVRRWLIDSRQASRCNSKMKKVLSLNRYH